MMVLLFGYIVKTRSQFYSIISQNILTWEMKFKSLFIKQNHPRPVLASSPHDNVIANSQKVRFEFYSDLTKQTEKLIGLPVESLAQQYVVDIATFADSVKASQYRVSLLLAGIEADVNQIQEKNRVMYHIQQGPFASVKTALLRQKKLQKKGYESVIKKL